MPLCSIKSGSQKPLSAKCLGKSCCHLHSTDIPFCDELDMGGSAKLNITAAVMELEEGEEEDEEEVVAAPIRHNLKMASEKRLLLKSNKMWGTHILLRDSKLWLSL